MPHNPHASSMPNIAAPPQDDDGIDVRNFPRWSRSWYADGSKSKLRDVGGPPIIFPDFDAPSSSRGVGRGVMYGAPTVSGTGSGSARDVLPWGAQLGDPDAPVPEEIKEERLRRLEREFGPRLPRAAADAPLAEDEPPEIGSVDDRGRLVTVGPKKRLTTRIVQALLSLGAAGAGIGASLLLHPKPPPPPAGTVPAIILDALSVLTFLFLLYILVFRACCTRNKSPAQSGLGMPGMPGGLMVLPVSQQAGKKNKKKGKKGGPPVPGDVHVNLIVDPAAFGVHQQPTRSRRRGGYSEISGEDDEFDDRPAPPRKSVFHGMAIEQSWRRARSFQKQLIAFDIVMVLAWAGAFIYATFIGKNCPPGQFGGWCDAYNLTLAGACLLAVFFSLSAFFDIRDLRMSAQNPRTRT